jgi:SPP1 family phage portal protein
MIAIDRSLLNADGSPDVTLLQAVLLKQDEVIKKRLLPLYKIYNRDHAITERIRLLGLPNNKLVHDFPKYISTMASGYLVGKPVQYKAPDEAKEAYKKLNEALEKAKSDCTDSELAMDSSIYGKGVELCYSDGNADVKSSSISPLFGFVVYDDTVEHKSLFGVMVTIKTNKTLTETGRRVTVYTPTQIVEYDSTSSANTWALPTETKRTAHHFGGVPMIEYWNNETETGDFEPAISLINAYDELQSDRVNDKQQFTDAIMVLKGMRGLEKPAAKEIDPSDPDYAAKVANEELKGNLTPSEYLAQAKTLSVPKDGDAGYLVKPDGETANELLRKSVADDIHKFTFVPNLTDEKFAGISSGVAMRFKLLGLEQLTGIKERWFREALRIRLRLFANFLSLKGAADLDIDKIQISFSRSLPVNELEIAQTLQAYKDLVPDELLMSQVPFVEDADKAVKDMQKQRADRAKESAMMFATTPLKANTASGNEEKAK